MGRYLDFTDTADGVAEFNRIYQVYHHALYVNILKIVRQEEIAQDLLQEVFITLWQHHRNVETERLPNWLFVVSYNKAISHLRKQERLPLAPLSGHETLPELTEINEDEFEEKLKLVDEAVGLLPPRRKLIFRRYRLEGKTIESIAAEFDVSVHTVRDHLKEANRFIRNHVLSKNPFVPGIELLLLLYLSGCQPAGPFL